MLVPVYHTPRYQWCLYSTLSLFCRKLPLVSHPSSCQLERDDFLEIMQCFKHLLQGHLLLRPALPCWPVQCPKHQVIVADDLRLLFGEKGGKKVFQVVLVCNEQITVGAIAARLVEREHLHWIDMDHQWQLPLVHFAITLRATRKAHILIGIEKEAVLRRLFAKLWHGFLFSLRHCCVSTACYKPLLSSSSFRARRLLLLLCKVVIYACHSGSCSCFWYSSLTRIK